MKIELPAVADPLGEALHFLRMSGTFYCRSEFRAPWALAIPPITKLVGEPAMRYVTRWRMGTARVLLAERNVTVGEVANSLGYESEAAINHAFKRYVGWSPGGVKRAH